LCGVSTADPGLRRPSRFAIGTTIESGPVIVSPPTPLALLLLALGPALLAARATAKERPYDGVQQLFYDEGSAALAEGRYRRAEQLFWRLARINPDDARALREAGRAAFALGDLEYAARTLARVEALHGGVPDPEIRYLRGQALVALGRESEGRAELAEAERQLSPSPPDRQSTLWLARIHALRGDVAGAELWYRTVLPKAYGSAEYAEVTMYIVEAHVLGKDWPGAERILRDFLAEQPENIRGLETLAWVLEGRGKIEEELPLRAALAESWGDHPRHVAGYARALERASEEAAALAKYREAATLGVANLDADIERLALRQSPELAAGMTFGSDTTGSMLGWVAGATLSFGPGLRVAVTGSGATITPMRPAGALEAPASVTSSSIGAQLLYNRRGTMAAAGATLRLPGASSSIGLGGGAALRTPAGRLFELHLSALVGQPWREATATIRQDGVVDSASVDTFTTLFSRRVILVLSAQGRRLGLQPMAGVDTPHALQFFGAAGLDVVLWSDPQRLVRGQVLDEDMMWAATLASGLIASYRHYEIVGDDPFGARLVLVGRSRIDEASAAFRYVVDDAGAVGFELHGGMGPDTVRHLLTSRAGGAILISATRSSRLTVAYDFASQLGTGPAGRRHFGSVTFHVDL
jgi:tetratricopeptide (TPR) repeat protein